MHPWLAFGSPIPRPSYATQGWAQPRGKELHRGVDLSVPIGTPVYAVGDGVVEFARPDYPGGTAGNWIGVRHAGEMLTRYLHLSKILVTVGQRVSKGQQIGVSGSTGHSTGPHLHFDAILPESRLPEYVALFGRPASGFLKGDFGYKVPGEPLIPIDKLSPEAVLGAARMGIPLYAQVPREGGGGGTVFAIVGLLALGGAGVYYLSRRRRTWR